MFAERQDSLGRINVASGIVGNHNSYRTNRSATVGPALGGSHGRLSRNSESQATGFPRYDTGSFKQPSKPKEPRKNTYDSVTMDARFVSAMETAAGADLRNAKLVTFKHARPPPGPRPSITSGNLQQSSVSQPT